MRNWPFLLKTLRIWPSWVAPLAVGTSLLLTLGFWMGSKIAYADWFENHWLYFSKTCALSAVTLMGWVFLLTTKALWTERLCGGLDKVYTLHRYIGKIVFFLLCLHPFFLSIARLPDWRSWALFFIFPYPSVNSYYELGANIGALSWVCLVVLIYLAFRPVNPYRRWLSWHKGMGIFYLFSLLHIILVERDIANYPFLFAWIWFWLALGAIAWIWTKFFRWVGPKAKYKIDHIEVERQIILLKLKAINEGLIFKPGQWVFLHIPSLGTDIHPFSIASIPNQDGGLVFGIRVVGSWTQQLQNAKKGEEVIAYGPYGMLSDAFLNSPRDCVCIGAGVGITPFIGMWALALHTYDQNNQEKLNPHIYNSWEEFIKKWHSPKLDLFYLVKSEKDAVFDPIIQQIGIASQFLHQTTVHERGHLYHLLISNNSQYISLFDVAERAGDLRQKTLLFCGPIEMIQMFKHQAKELEIPTSQIFFEVFDWRQPRIDPN